MCQSYYRVSLVLLCCLVCCGTGVANELNSSSGSTIPGLASPKLVSKTHDLSAAIEMHVKGSTQAKDVAKANAIAELFWVPREQPLMTKKEIAPGQFMVVAPEWFHDHLVGMAKWMADGEKQISIEARIATVSEATLRDMHLQFAAAWEMAEQPSPVVLEPKGNGFELRSTDALVQAPRTLGPDFSRKALHVNAENKPFASMSVRQLLPCRVARASDRQVRRLVNSLQSDTRSNILQAPKVTIFSGQQAEVKDTTSRPFVTSVVPIKGEEGTAMQPVITVLEDGLRLQLHAVAEGDDRIHMDSNVIFGEVGDVEEFTFDGPGEAVGTTVQIPKYIQRSVEVSKRLRNGQSLIIDPHFVSEEVTKRRFRSDVVTRKYTIVILTPRVFRTNTIEAEEVGESKVAKL